MIAFFLFFLISYTTGQHYQDEINSEDDYNTPENHAKYYRDTIQTTTYRPPQIISHKQAQNHDGAFKFAFAAENGLAQGEIIAPDGSRTGGYSYVDPHGKKITVKYTAGKEGFRIVDSGQDNTSQDNSHIDFPQPIPRQSQQEDDNDDGQYYPEKYEKPEYNEQPTYQHENHLYKQPSYFTPKAEYHTSLVSNSPSQYYQYPIDRSNLQTKYEPESQRKFEAQPNKLQTDKGPEYNDEPGQPYSFGKGYFFHFKG